MGVKKIVHCTDDFVISRFFFIYFTFIGVKKIVLYIEDFVISRFFFTYFTIIGVKKIVLYIEDFVISRFVESRFHCRRRFADGLNMLDSTDHSINYNFL